MRVHRKVPTEPAALLYWPAEVNLDLSLERNATIYRLVVPELNGRF